MPAAPANFTPESNTQSSGLRGTAYTTMTHTWSSSDPASSLNWDGKGITYWIDVSGPLNGSVAFVNAVASRGYCTLTNAGVNVSCNLGLVPSAEKVDITFTIAWLDQGDWVNIGWNNGFGDIVYGTRVLRPYSYDSNRAIDGSFEEVSAPSWFASSPAKQVCNRTGVPGKKDKIVANVGECGMQFVDGGTIQQTLRFNDYLDGGDVLWISYDVSGKNLLGKPKFTVKFTDVFGKTKRWKWNMYNKGSYDYQGQYFSGQVFSPTGKIELTVKGGKGGKTLVDDIQVYVVHLEDLTSARSASETLPLPAF